MEDAEREKFVADTVLDVFNIIQKEHGAYTSGEALVSTSAVATSLLLSIYRTVKPEVREALKVLWMREIEEFSMKDEPS